MVIGMAVICVGAIAVLHGDFWPHDCCNVHAACAVPTLRPITRITIHAHAELVVAFVVMMMMMLAPMMVMRVMVVVVVFRAPLAMRCFRIV